MPGSTGSLDVVVGGGYSLAGENSTTSAVAEVVMVEIRRFELLT
jgi:hypothetical protein